jgi:hypothetical protein
MPLLLILADVLCIAVWLCVAFAVGMLVYGFAFHPRPRQTLYFRPSTSRSVLCDPRL